MGTEGPQITDSLPNNTKVPVHQNDRNEATEIKYAEENVTPTFEEVDLVSRCSSPDSMENTEDTEGFHDDNQLDSLCNVHQFNDHDKPENEYESRDENHIDHNSNPKHSSPVKKLHDYANTASDVNNVEKLPNPEPKDDSANIASDVDHVEKHPNQEPIKRSQSCTSDSSSHSKAWKQIAKLKKSKCLLLL